MERRIGRMKMAWGFVVSCLCKLEFSVVIHCKEGLKKLEELPSAQQNTRVR